jgi:hypothetical protein
VKRKDVKRKDVKRELWEGDVGQEIFQFIGVWIGVVWNPFLAQGAAALLWDHRQQQVGDLGQQL